jgi:hypothetical protein
VWVRVDDPDVGIAGVAAALRVVVSPGRSACAGMEGAARWAAPSRGPRVAASSSTPRYPPVLAGVRQP